MTVSDAISLFTVPPKLKFIFKTWVYRFNAPYRSEMAVKAKHLVYRQHSIVKGKSYDRKSDMHGTTTADL
jgi:hypothetical protein